MRPEINKKNPLYAIAVEKFNGEVWIPDIVYMHAENQGRARFLYVAGLPKGEFERTKIVAIGPAIGYFEREYQGRIITTV